MIASYSEAKFAHGLRNGPQGQGPQEAPIKRIITDLTYLIDKEKDKFGGGNKALIEQFEKKREKVTNWIPKQKKKK